MKGRDEQLGNWAPLTRPSEGLMTLLGEQLGDIDRMEPGVIPDLRGGDALWVGSDYGGMHQTAKYETYSFIITNDAAVPEWDQLRRAWRDKYLSFPGNAKPPEMSFKKLNSDKARARALSGFLKVADSLTGLVLTVAVEKSIGSMSPDRLPENEAVWKPAVFDRVMRYCHFIGLLVSCLSRDGQDVGWVTDRDQIADSDRRKEKLVQSLAHVMASLYLGHKLGRMIVLTNESDSDMSWSDLLAIPDLIAGAFSEMLDHHQSKVREAGLTVGQTFSMKDVQPKTKEILDWHLEKSHPLRRLFLVVDTNEDTDSDEPFNIMWPDLVRFPRTKPQPPSLFISGRSVFKRRRLLRRSSVTNDVVL